MALVAVGFGIVLISGLISAQDKAPNPAPSEKKGLPPAGPEQMGRRMPGMPGGAMEGFAENGRVRDEIKRHSDVMNGIREETKALREKIKKETEPQKNNPENKVKPEPKEGVNPPDNKNQPANPEAMKEAMMKKREAYRPEALQIAAKATAEMLLHYQNLAKITGEEQEDIKNKIADVLILPPPHRMPEMGKRPDKQEKPDSKSGITPK